MATTIALSSDSHKELIMLKVEEGFRNMDELVRQLIIQYKKNKLVRASENIRKRMKELKLSLSDLIE